MFDSLFMRHWEAGPGKFSSHLGRAAARRRQRASGTRRAQDSIGNAYGFLDKYDAQPAARPALNESAQASLRGLAASVITFALWITVMALATPMPLLASTVDTPVAEAVACSAPVALA